MDISNGHDNLANADCIILDVEVEGIVDNYK